MPGLGWRDPSGQYSGFDVEIARMIASRLGFGVDRVRYDPVPTAARETAIDTALIDFYVGVYQITDGRKQKVSFAGPYLSAAQAILVRAGETRITGAGKLDGRVVCGVQGTLPLARIRELGLTDANKIVETGDYADCVNRMMRGHVDALITDDVILRAFAAQLPDRLKVVIDDFGFAPVSDYGIGLAHDDALRGRMNEILQSAYDDGTWARLYDEALGASGVPGQPPAIEPS